MNSSSRKLFFVLLAAGAMAGCNNDKDKKKVAEAEPAATAAPAAAPEKPLTVEDSVLINVTARVKAIDLSSRLLTLTDSSGHEMTLLIGPTVARLHEVRVGDMVNARYRASLLAELRPPTADETATPIAVIGSGSASRDAGNPVGSRTNAIRVVTTVEAVNVPNMLVTLRGPMGDVATVRGRRPENIRRLKVGDTIVITYSETLVMALDKVTP